jgi:surface protein
VFDNASAFNQSLAAWNISQVNTIRGLFKETLVTPQNYSDTIIGWAALPTLQSNVDYETDGIPYTPAAVSARNRLITDFNWTINDGGLYVEPVNNQFVTIWDTSLDSGSANKLRLSFGGSTPSSFVIDWGDGSTQYFGSMPSGDIEHTYATSGLKTVTITGTFPYFYPACDSGPEYDKLVDVLDWGTLPWDYFNFYQCSYLDDFSATNAPNLSVMTDMSSMFYGTQFNGDISNWDVSNITNMADMFRQANNFNQDLSEWDISNVTNTVDMFRSTVLSTSNYTKILLGWSQLVVGDFAGLGTVGMTGSETPYCSSAQPAWDILTTIYNWSNTDGGPVPCKTATYLVGAEGSLIGDAFQYIADGEEGTAITVVPAAGYRFVRWSDGSSANPRTDENLAVDITVTAIVELEGNAFKRMSTRIGVRME